MTLPSQPIHLTVGAALHCFFLLWNFCLCDLILKEEKREEDEEEGNGCTVQ